jgi:hypothetical protein
MLVAPGKRVLQRIQRQQPAPHTCRLQRTTQELFYVLARHAMHFFLRFTNNVFTQQGSRRSADCASAPLKPHAADPAIVQHNLHDYLVPAQRINLYGLRVCMRSQSPIPRIAGVIQNVCSVQVHRWCSLNLPGALARFDT